MFEWTASDGYAHPELYGEYKSKSVFRAEGEPWVFRATITTHNRLYEGEVQLLNGDRWGGFSCYDHTGDSVPEVVRVLEAWVSDTEVAGLRSMCWRRRMTQEMLEQAKGA